MIIDREKIKNHRNPILIGILLMSIFVNAGFFPIVNFNPDNPVDLGIIMKLIVIVMAFTFHKYIGSLEAVVFSKWSAIFVGIFNITVILCGLGCRYLLEFGEVSNTYNFTILNVIFQVILLGAISTIVYLLERKRN